MTRGEACAELERRGAMLIMGGELLGQHPALALLRDALDRFIAASREDGVTVRSRWILPHSAHMSLDSTEMGMLIVSEGMEIVDTSAPTAALRIFQQLRDDPVKILETLNRIDDVVREVEQSIR